ncbi:hypothetical protein IWZ00DRAFT_354864 [Phyllosticta capitalensis]
MLRSQALPSGGPNAHAAASIAETWQENTSLCLATIRTIPPQTTVIPAGLILCPRRLGPKGGLWRPALLQLGNFSTTHLGAWSAIQSKDRPPLQSSGPMTDRSQIMHAMQRSRSLSRLCFSPAMGLICTALPSARHPQRFEFAEGTDRAESNTQRACGSRRCLPSSKKTRLASPDKVPSPLRSHTQIIPCVVVLAYPTQHLVAVPRVSPLLVRRGSGRFGKPTPL